MKKYDCFGFIVYELGYGELETKEIDLPKNYQEILDSKKYIKSLIRHCECGEIGTPQYIKKTVTGFNQAKYTQYLDYTIEKCLCIKCYEKYTQWEKLNH